MQIHAMDVYAYHISISSMRIGPRLVLATVNVSKGRPNDQTRQRADCRRPVTEELGAVETLYRAFSEANPDLLDDAVTTDWQDIPLAPHQQPGRGMKPLIKEFAAAFPDLKITLLEVIGAPGRAAVRGLITGTHKGEWFGIALIFKPFQMPIHALITSPTARWPIPGISKNWFGWLFKVGCLACRNAGGRIK